MPLRGSYSFEVNDSGNIIYSENNIKLLRKLWLDRSIISFEELGPGDPGDFDNGAWHSSCHLVAAGGVCRNTNRKISWLEISYDSQTCLYKPTITFREDNEILTIDMNSSRALENLQNSKIVGFVEGTSGGRISAKGIIDSREMFNNNPRQDYDQEPESTKEGGRVWEHWCTLRDIRDNSQIASSVLSAYVALTSVLGDSFAATVLRGRNEYGHPEQLCAMVQAGFISKESALLEMTPKQIPLNVEAKLKTADPKNAFEGIEMLEWFEEQPSYYMFERKIGSWCTSNYIANEFYNFGL
jgi:hypothetical protein